MIMNCARQHDPNATSSERKTWKKRWFTIIMPHDCNTANRPDNIYSPIGDVPRNLLSRDSNPSANAHSFMNTICIPSTHSVSFESSTSTRTLRWPEFVLIEDDPSTVKARDRRHENINKCRREGSSREMKGGRKKHRFEKQKMKNEAP